MPPLVSVHLARVQLAVGNLINISDAIAIVVHLVVLHGLIGDEDPLAPCTSRRAHAWWFLEQPLSGSTIVAALDLHKPTQHDAEANSSYGLAPHSEVPCTPTASSQGRVSMRQSSEVAGVVAAHDSLSTCVDTRRQPPSSRRLRALSTTSPAIQQASHSATQLAGCHVAGQVAGQCVASLVAWH